MKHLLFRLLAASGLLMLPVSAVPAVQQITVGNVTSSGACVAWEFTETARPGLEVFTDAAATQNVTTSVRVEVQSLENARRETTSTSASRESNRDLQDAMNAKAVALVRISGLDPETDYFVRPQALAATTDTVLATGALTPLTTARTASFVPESRQLIADLSALVPTTGDVSGGILIATHAQSAYPLLAVIGDGTSSTSAYFDLSLLLDAIGDTNLIPSAGALALTLSWLGLPDVEGVFQPDTVSYTGTAKVAASSTTEFVGQGFVVHAAPSSSSTLVGIPVTVNLSVTDVGGVVQTTFNRALIVESPALSTGAGNTPYLVSGVLNNHQLVFSTAGTHTVTVRDSASSASTTFDVTVRPMTYQNWRTYHLGGSQSAGGVSANPDADPFPNFVEFVHGRNPNSPDASILGTTPRQPGKALTIRFDLNPYQQDYKVVIQVAPNMNSWQRSAKVPQVVQSFPTHDLMEVSWTEAELQAETGVASTGYFARLTWEPATNFTSWLGAYSLTGPAASPTANPDGDNDPNFVEFALDSNPTSGAASGKVRQTVASFGASFAQILTIPVRLGATTPSWDPAGGELILEADGIRYRIQGTANLVSWNLTMTEVPAVTSGLPELNPGYEYRSFRSPGSSSYSFEFVRAKIEKY